MVALPIPEDIPAPGDTAAPTVVEATYRSSGAALIKRPWTQEEDNALALAVQKYGAARWSMIATQVGTGRIGKQCRERWNNHLCPEVKKTEWSEEEDRAIMQGVAVMGTRWCEIIKAPELSGRTDNSIKNRFYALQRKMKAKQPGADRGNRQSPDSPASDEPPLLGPTDRIMAIARELAFATDEYDRDRLIEQLTEALHEREAAMNAEGAAMCPTDTLEDVSSHVEAAHADDLLTLTEELFSPGSPHMDELLVPSGVAIAEFLQLPQSPQRADLSQQHDLSLSGGTAAPSLTRQYSDAESSTSSSASTASPGVASGATARGLAPWSLPESCEMGEDLASASPTGGPALRKPMMPEESSDNDATAACLGGRHAYKAVLSPLHLPLESNSPMDESPKRMRTTPKGGSAVPWHSRRPTALAVSRSPSSTDDVHVLSPSCTVTGTKEPGMVCDDDSASPSSTITADFLSLATFSDLFGDEASLAELENGLPASCGKRKGRTAECSPVAASPSATAISSASPGTPTRPLSCRRLTQQVNGRRAFPIM